MLTFSTMIHVYAVKTYYRFGKFPENVRKNLIFANIRVLVALQIQSSR